MEDRNESFSKAIKQKVLYCSLKTFIFLASNLSLYSCCSTTITVQLSLSFIIDKLKLLQFLFSYFLLVSRTQVYNSDLHIRTPRHGRDSPQQCREDSLHYQHILCTSSASGYTSDGRDTPSHPEMIKSSQKYLNI